MNYRKLLEKYMRNVLDAEGTTFVSDIWDGKYCPYECSFAEHAVLLKLREKIVREWKK